MKDSIIKQSLGLLGKYIVVLIMSIIITVSFFMIFAATAGEGGVVTGITYIIMLIISEIFTLGTLVLFLNGKAFYIGDSDANKVNFGRLEYDRFKGFKLGIAPALFALATWIVLVLGKLGIFAKGVAFLIFSFSNYHLYGYMQLIFSKSTNLDEIGWTSIFLALLTVIIVPIITQICYMLGYKRINLLEKIVFKKKGDK